MRIKPLNREERKARRDARIARLNARHHEPREERPKPDMHIMPAQAMRPWYFGRRIEAAGWVGIIALSLFLAVAHYIWTVL